MMSDKGEQGMNSVNRVDRRDFIAWTEGKEPDDQGISLDKVVFLDIDGVLNDEGTNYRKGVIIDREMVKCLQTIVTETAAEIILTSSWRLDYLRFVEAGYKTTDKELIELDTALTDAGLTVRGIVPITSWSGPSSRPAEICTWLEAIPVSKYVILDDDDFWMWEEYGLKDHLVLTKRKESWDFIRGLKSKNVQQAIAILK